MTARRSSGQYIGHDTRDLARRSVDEPAVQILYDLEQLAIEQTSAGSHGWADRTRDIARRLT